MQNDTEISIEEKYRILSEAVDYEAKTGAGIIAAERLRQQRVEGYDAANDDDYDDAQLAEGAGVYLEAARRQIGEHAGPASALADCRFTDCWPWSKDSLKLSDDPVRNLVKAGAMIAAEIDRLQRQKARETQAA